MFSLQTCKIDNRTIFSFYMEQPLGHRLLFATMFIISCIILCIPDSDVQTSGLVSV